LKVGLFLTGKSLLVLVKILLLKRSVPVDVQDLPYWFCALCHRREIIMLESDQLEKTKPFQQKRQNGTVDPSLFSLHLIEGRVIPD
jgi:hypothetical protein